MILFSRFANETIDRLTREKIELVEEKSKLMADVKRLNERLGIALKKEETVDQLMKQYQTEIKNARKLQQEYKELIDKTIIEKEKYESEMNDLLGRLKNKH